MAGVHAVCARMVNYRVWGYRCGGADVGVVGWRGEGVGDGNVEGCRCGDGGWRGAGVGDGSVEGCRCGVEVWRCAGVEVGVWRV